MSILRPFLHLSLDGELLENNVLINHRLQGALLTNASGVILAHNHPSGNLNPSTPDKAMTQKIRQALTVMDIKLLDYLIVTRESYFSFADEGVM